MMERGVHRRIDQVMARTPRLLLRRPERGFTLVELMTVVVMVGILATVGIALFRRWVFHSRSIEAIGMVQSIRVAQERWRSENSNYIDVSATMTSWYPMTNPGRTLYDWNQAGGNNYDRWRLLNPTISGAVQFAYVTKAGPAFTVLPAPSTADQPPWPQAAQMTSPWYIIQAMGDTDEDGVKSYYLATSLNGELYKENEGE